MSVVLDIIEPLGDVSLWCQDETSKRLESNNFYSWSPVGKPTEIECNGCHKGINIIGATEVLNHMGFVYDVYSKKEGSLTAAHVVKYMERLLDYDKARGISTTFVQWDNSPIHKGPLIQEFVEAHKSDLIVLHQPPSIISNFLSLSRIILNFRFLQNKLHEQVLHIYINMDGDVYPF